MHRRPLAPSLAPSAAFARRFGLGAALLGLAAVVAAHHPRVPPTAALTGLGAALALAGLALLCGLGAMRTIWRTGQPGLGRALFGMLLGGLVLAYPGYVAAMAWRTPATVAAGTDHDPSLRLARSVRAVRLRGLERTGGSPDIAVVAEPLTLEMSANDAYELVDDVLDALRWQRVDAVPPGGRLGLGHLDAVTFSPVMHLPQDIAVRITPAGGTSRIDVLSVARLGVTDFGEGANTIRQLTDAIKAQEDD